MTEESGQGPTSRPPKQACYLESAGSGECRQAFEEALPLCRFRGRWGCLLAYGGAQLFGGGKGAQASCGRPKESGGLQRLPQEALAGVPGLVQREKAQARDEEARDAQPEQQLPPRRFRYRCVQHLCRIFVVSSAAAASTFLGDSWHACF